MKKLIALLVIAVGALAPDSKEVPVGGTFEAPDDIADQLVVSGQAQLAPDAVSSPANPTRTPKQQKVRILRDCDYGKVNDVITLDADLVKSAEAAGLADSNKAAVAYAASLQSET